MTGQITPEALMRSCGMLRDDAEGVAVQQLGCELAQELTGLSHADWHMLEDAMREGVVPVARAIAEADMPDDLTEGDVVAVDFAQIAISSLVMGMQIGATAQRMKNQGALVADITPHTEDDDGS